MKWNAKEHAAAVLVELLIEGGIWSRIIPVQCNSFMKLSNLVLIDRLMRKGLTLVLALVIEWCNYGLQHY